MKFWRYSWKCWKDWWNYSYRCFPNLRYYLKFRKSRFWGEYTERGFINGPPNVSPNQPLRAWLRRRSKLTTQKTTAKNSTQGRKQNENQRAHVDDVGVGAFCAKTAHREVLGTTSRWAVFWVCSDGGIWVAVSEMNREFHAHFWKNKIKNKIKIQ